MHERPIVQHHPGREAQVRREQGRHAPAQRCEQRPPAAGGPQVVKTFEPGPEAGERFAQRGGSFGRPVLGQGAFELRQSVLDVDRRGAGVRSAVHEDGQDADRVGVREQRVQPGGREICCRELLRVQRVSISC